MDAGSSGGDGDVANDAVVFLITSIIKYSVIPIGGANRVMPCAYKR